MSKKISEGTVHKIPKDLESALMYNKKSFDTWENITPLARNEWICWVISVKQEKTRTEHIERAIADLKAGKRRPCCWYGCIHRKDKTVSKSVRNLVLKRS